MKIALLTTLGILTFASLGNLTAGTFSITNTVTDTVGTTAVVTGSGDKNNTNTWATGVVGRFELNGGEYFLQVTATDPTGALEAEAGEDSLMVARTVNSQGLTDQGTLSVYVNTSPESGVWSLDLTFSFFSDISFNTPVSVDLLLTSLDIDYDQLYFTSTDDFTSNTRYPGTEVDTFSATGYNGFTAAGDAVFSDPTHAVSSFGTGNSFNVRISHDQVALYMFEFRDPSSIVPEPGTAALALGGIAVVSLIRRKARQA